MVQRARTAAPTAGIVAPARAAKRWGRGARWPASTDQISSERLTVQTETAGSSTRA